jgi:uncharacterized pyridoxal phosphate-containing UPF0001 family protein
VDRRAREAGKVLDVMVEVNLAGEPSKAGASPEEVGPLVAAAADLPGVRVRGLMAIPPHAEDPGASRPWFRALRELLGRAGSAGREEMTELSMGMSGDFEAAVEEGATLVRVGTALFGSRERRGA